ncbi:glucose import [Tritrichomonas musculus]|uniref:Glucose import n=1 Tax=Tritrichomonas musculus TaxID=1915356 RepID=A0ABR2HN33_9EUKA
MVPDVHTKPKSVKNEYIFSRTYIKQVLVMIMLMVLQQLSGIGILLGQLSRILSGIGLNIESLFQSIIFNFVGVISSFIAAFISDTIGTRYMWPFSAFGLCIGLVPYSVTLKIELPIWVLSLVLFIYFLFFGLGTGPIPWYVCGTFFPEEVRIESAAICICTHTFLSPILDVFWKAMYQNLSEFGEIIFSSLICFLSIILGFLIPVENIEKFDTITII